MNDDAATWLEGGTRVRASDGQIWTDVVEEVVILSMDAGAYFGLEQVGARIWKLLQVPRPLSEIEDVLVAEYEVDRERCFRDLRALLLHMWRRGLVELEPSPPRD